MPSYTVVKWGHTKGIEREKTSSEKYTVISLNFWRDKLFLVFQIWGQNTFGGQFLEHCHLIWNCPPIVFCPQSWKTTCHYFLREITVYFSDEVFSLGMPSVCPHLTTVYVVNISLVKKERQLMSYSAW